MIRLLRWLKPLPWGLVGMLVLAVALEGSIRRQGLELTNFDSWNWAWVGKAARKHAVGSEVLCLGDSLIKCGLIPRVIEQRTGKSAFNLAVFAGEAPTSYFLLRRALESGARPKAIVVGFKPSILALGYRSTMDRWPGLLNARDCFDLACTARDASFIGETMLTCNLPSLKARQPIRTSVLAAFRGESTHFAADLVLARRNITTNRGAYIVPRNAHFKGQFVSADPLLFPDAWRFDPINIIYVRRFLDLASARQIPVFWVLTPVSPGAQALYDQKGLDATYTDFVRSESARLPNVTILDGRHSSYDTGVFMDSTHVARPGACTLSADVADIVDQALKAPNAARSRWVMLPAFREIPAEVVIEDTEQTLHAIAEAGKRRVQ